MRRRLSKLTANFCVFLRQAESVSAVVWFEAESVRVVSRARLCGSGFEFGPKVDKNFGLNSGLRHTFCLWCTKI